MCWWKYKYLKLKYKNIRDFLNSALMWTQVTCEKRKLKFLGETNASPNLRAQNEIKFYKVWVHLSNNTKNGCDELANGKIKETVMDSLQNTSVPHTLLLNTSTTGTKVFLFLDQKERLSRICLSKKNINNIFSLHNRLTPSVMKLRTSDAWNGQSIHNKVVLCLYTLEL